MAAAKAKHLDGYVRISRIQGREGESYLSPDLQKAAIERYVAERLPGAKIVRWHVDEDESGGKLTRPAFDAALARLRAGESDGLVVKAVDRFARTAEAVTLIREIQERGQVFASAEESIDTTPAGQFMLNQFLAIAELALNNLKAGWETAKGTAVARGAHIGPTPIGYKRERNNGKSGKLSPDPAYGPTIRDLFRRAATGDYTDTQLARWVSEQVERPKGGRAFQPSEIRRWLSARVYLGEVRYGELVNPEAHKPLTDAETFQRCQREPGLQRKGNGTSLLAGRLRCAQCRYAMTLQSDNGGGVAVYRCNGGSACISGSVITQSRVETHIRDVVLDHVRGLRLEAVGDGINLQQIERDLVDAEDDLKAFAANGELRRALGEAAYQETTTEYVGTVESTREARDEAYRKAQLDEALAVDIDADLDKNALRDLMGGLVRTVFVRRTPYRGAGADERCLVVWADDDRKIALPGPHVSGSFKPITW